MLAVAARLAGHKRVEEEQAYPEFRGCAEEVVKATNKSYRTLHPLSLPAGVTYKLPSSSAKCFANRSARPGEEALRTSTKFPLRKRSVV